MKTHMVLIDAAVSARTRVENRYNGRQGKLMNELHFVMS